MKYILFGLILTLTLAGCATTPQAKDRVLIITNNDCFIGQEINVENISEILNPSDRVLLSAQKITSHERVASVVKECNDAGVTNITFSTSE